MAGVATSFAAEQAIPVQFLCGEGCLARKIIIEFRREGTDAVGRLISGNGLGEFVEILASESAIGGAELKRSGMSTKHSGALRSAAYRYDVGRPIDFQRADAEDRLKEELDVALADLPHLANGIWIGQFFVIAWWLLSL